MLRVYSALPSNTPYQREADVLPSMLLTCVTHMLVTCVYTVWTLSAQSSGGCVGPAGASI